MTVTQTAAQKELAQLVACQGFALAHSMKWGKDIWVDPETGNLLVLQLHCHLVAEPDYECFHSEPREITPDPSFYSLHEKKLDHPTYIALLIQKHNPHLTVSDFSDSEKTYELVLTDPTDGTWLGHIYAAYTGAEIQKSFEALQNA